MPQIQARYWIGTLNNPDCSPTEFVAKAEKLTKFKFIILQLERGENGTPHFQFYLEFEKPKRLMFLKNNLSDRGHYEKRRGSAQQAYDYCSKDDTRIDGPYQAGEWNPQTPGKDIIEG